MERDLHLPLRRHFPLSRERGGSARLSKCCEMVEIFNFNFRMFCVHCSPVDLCTIKRLIENGTVETFDQMSNLLCLMYANAVMFNSTGHDVNFAAKDMYQRTFRAIQVVRRVSIILWNIFNRRYFAKNFLNLAEKEDNSNYMILNIFIFLRLVCIDNFPKGYEMNKIPTFISLSEFFQITETFRLFLCIAQKAPIITFFITLLEKKRANYSYLFSKSAQIAQKVLE